MRSRLSALAVVLATLVLAATPAVSQRSGELPDLPGPFHPFNVNGDFKGRYHCLVTDHDLDPAALLFVQGTDFPAPVKELVKKLDNLAVKNPNARLAVFVVVLDDKQLPDVVKNDDEREKLAKELDTLKDALMLEKTVFALDSRPDLTRYKLDEKAETTVILYRRFRIYARYDLPPGGLTPEKSQEILDIVKTKFEAKRE